MEHALPSRTADIPRSWSLLLTSENHGAVGPLGSTFPHAGEKHERVQVVEIVATGSAPAPGVDLAGLVRFGFCDINDDEFLERPDGAYFLAHEVEARCASAAPVAAQAGQAAMPLPAWRGIKAVLTNLIAVASIRISDKDEDDDQLIDDAAEAVRQLDAAMQASTSGERQEGGA